MLAVENKYTEGVELLMKYATKQTNNKGDTALIIAARKGLVEVVDLHNIHSPVKQVHLSVCRPNCNPLFDNCEAVWKS